MAIFQKRGKWFIDYRVHGVRTRECVGASHKLAKEALAKRRAEIAEGRYFPERVANRQQFAAFVERFWDKHGHKMRSKSWGRKVDGKWNGMVGRFIEEFGNKTLAEITTAQLQDLYNGIEEENSSSTANRYHTLIRRIYSLAEKWGDFYGVNPCKGVQRRGEAAPRERYLTQEEIEVFLRSCGPRLVPVATCALLTGMRKGEILGLEWDAVDFLAGTITLRRTKSGKGRTLQVPPRLRALLLAMGPRDSGRVFDLPEITFRREFAKAAKASSLPAFVFHDLRHTFASHYMMRGGKIELLSRILGHSTIQMTMRYVKFAPGIMTAQMAEVEAVVPLIGLPGPTVALPEPTKSLPTA